MELKIQSERVLEAAASCPDAKRVLEKVFPEAFVTKRNKFETAAAKRLADSTATLLADENNLALVCVRTSGPYRGKVLYLSANYKWEVVKEDSMTTILVPTLKEGY